MPLSGEAISRAEAWAKQRKQQELQTAVRFGFNESAEETRRISQLATQADVPFGVAQSDPTAAQVRAGTRGIDYAAMERDTPATARWFSDRTQASMTHDDLDVMMRLEKLQATGGRSFIGNLGLGMADRGLEIVGNLVQAAGTLAAVAPSSFMGPVARVTGPLTTGVAATVGAAAETFKDPRFREDGTINGKVFADALANAFAADHPLAQSLKDVGQAMSDADVGYKPRYTWEGFKGEMTATNLAGFVAETGAQSLVDVAGMMISLPAYIASRSQEIGEERAALKGKDGADIQEFMEALPTAVAVALLDKWSASAALGLSRLPVLKRFQAGVTAPFVMSRRGATLLPLTAQKGFAQLPGQVVGAAGMEAATEFVQEQVEYLGERVGTGAAISLQESLDRGLAGAVAGGGMGGALRGAVGIPQAIQETRALRKMEKVLESVEAQQNIDETLEAVNESKTVKEAPEKAGEFIDTLNQENRFYVAPEGIQQALDAGVSLPEEVITQHQANPEADAVISLNTLALKIAPNEQAMEFLRPHLKRNPESETFAEMEEGDTDVLARDLEAIQEEMLLDVEVNKVMADFRAKFDEEQALPRDVTSHTVSMLGAFIKTKTKNLKARGIDTNAIEIMEALDFDVKVSGEAGARGSISIDRNTGKRTIQLNRLADESTIVHEMAHLFLDAEARLAEKYGADPDQQELLDLLEVSTFEELLDTSDESVKEKHELFARTFESYVIDGQAPTVELRDTMRDFGRWLGEVYRGAQSDLGETLPLSEDVRGALDRLLATDVEIQALQQEDVYSALFDGKAEELGMTEKERKKYRKVLEQRNKRASRTLFDKLLAQMTRTRKKEWRDEVTRRAPEELEALQKQPVYRAIAIARENKMDRNAVREALTAIYPDATFKGTSLTGLTADVGGVDPAIIADEAGYGSVVDMVREIHDAPSIDKAAAEAAHERMLDEKGDILADNKIREEAEAAMQNPSQAEALLMELTAIGRQMKKRGRTAPTVSRRHLRYKAQVAVAKMKWGELKPARFLRAMQRAAKKEAKATNPEEKFAAKEQELANYYLFVEASKAHHNAIKWRKHVLAVKERDYSTRQVDPEYINAMKVLSMSYDPDNRASKLQRWERGHKVLQFIKSQYAAGVAVNIKDLNLVELSLGTDFLPKFSDLTIEQLRSVYDQLRHLRFIGGRIGQINMAALREEATDLIARAKETRTLKEDKDVNISGQARQRETLRNRWQQGIFGYVSLSNLLRKYDSEWGDSRGGPFYKTVMLRLHKAESMKNDLDEEFFTEFKQQSGGIDLRRIPDTNASMLSVSRADGSRWSLSRQARIMLGVYWGSETAREAVRKGFGVEEEQIEKMLSYLTTDDVKIIKGVWAMSEYMKPKLFEAAVARDGVAPPEEAFAPFVVNGEELRGGHFQLYYTGADMDLDDKHRLDKQAVDPVNTLTNRKAGSAYARSGSGGRPVDLNLSNVARTVEENSHFIAYAKPASDLQVIFNQRELKNTLAETHGKGATVALLQNIRSQTTNYKEPDSIAWLAGMSRRLQVAASMMYLAYSVKNISEQTVSVIPVMGEMGMFNYVNMTKEFYSNYAANKEFVDRSSSMMRGRKRHLNRELAELQSRILKGSAAESGWQTFQRHGFTPHVWIDEKISYPAWMGWYQQGMSRHGDRARAVADADTKVAETIGSGHDLYLSNLLKSNENWMVKLLTLFGSWFNSSVFQRVYRGTQGGKEWLSREAFNAVTTSVFVPAILSAYLARQMPGFDEDEDDYVTEWFKGAGIQTFRFGAATLPIINLMLPTASRVNPSTLLHQALSGVWKHGTKIVDPDEDMSPYERAEAGMRLVGSFWRLPGSGNVVRMLDYLGSAEKGQEAEVEDAIDAISATHQALVEGADRQR